MFFSLLLISCSKNIEPINYGDDACAFCTMNIVDKTHAAQVVTDKGRNYKFDSSECMIQYLGRENNESEMLHILSADYLNPGLMIDAREATFIISENIPSPMGAFLSAVKDKEEAVKLQNESGGTLYNWENVKNQISIR